MITITAEKIRIAGIENRNEVWENETTCSGISFLSICLPPLTINTKPRYKLNVPKVTIIEWTLNLVTITPFINPITNPTEAVIKRDIHKERPGNSI